MPKLLLRRHLKLLVMPNVKKLLKSLEKNKKKGPSAPGIGNLGSGNPSVKPLTEKQKERIGKRALKKAGRKAARKLRGEWSGQFDSPPIG